MSFCEDLYFNIAINSTSYLALLVTYALSLYELWRGEVKNEEDIKKKNVETTILLLLPHIIALLEINKIQILSLFLKKKQLLQIKQKQFLNEIKEIHNNILKSVKGADKNEDIIGEFKSLLEDIEALKEKKVDKEHFVNMNYRVKRRRVIRYIKKKKH